MKNQRTTLIKANKQVLAVPLALGLAILPSLSLAQWTVLGSFNPANGRPNGMTDSTAQISADIVTRVNSLLGAERSNISQNPETQALLTDDLGGNLFLTKNANIKVAFLSEGAGFTNAIGFFRFNKAGLPRPTITNETIFFPNASTPHLGFGDTVDLGNFSAGDAIGFTVVADGWRSPGVRSRTADDIFRTVKDLNPEREPRNAHTVLLSSPENKLLVLGMEDLNRERRHADGTFSSDDDFNDIIIAILVEPFDALDSGAIVNVDTGTTSEAPEEPGGAAGTKPLITTGSGAAGTPPGGGGGGNRPIGVSGRQNWHEKTEQR